jgi:hypothetical protein
MLIRHRFKELLASALYSVVAADGKRRKMKMEKDPA